MEGLASKQGNVQGVLRWSRLVVKRSRIPRSALLSGLGLVLVLGGLAPILPALAIVGSCTVLLLALIERRPIFVVYGLVLLLPLTGGLARGAAIPLLRVGQALVVLGFTLFWLSKSAPQGKFRFTAIDLIFVLYLLAGMAFPLFSLYYRGETLNFTAVNDGTGSSPLQSLLGPVQYYLLYRIIVATVSSEKHIRIVLYLTFIASMLVSIIGILEEMHVGPVVTILTTYYPIPNTSSDYNDVNIRIASTLQHYSGLGAYLSITLIIVLCCHLAQDRMKISPLVLLITTLLDSVALVLSGTFAAWIALVVGTVVVCRIFRRVPRAVIYAVIGVALAVLIFNSFIFARLDFQLGQGQTQGILPESFAYRVMLWQRYAIPAIRQHLVFGWGPAPAILANGFFVEESQYFHLLLEGGIVYLFSYILLVGVAFTTCWRRMKSNSQDVGSVVAIATFVILIAINVMNISGEYFTYVGGAQTFWILLATVVAGNPIETNSSYLWGSTSGVANMMHRSQHRKVERPVETSLYEIRRRPSKIFHWRGTQE